MYRKITIMNLSEKSKKPRDPQSDVGYCTKFTEHGRLASVLDNKDPKELRMNTLTYCRK